MTLSLPQQQSHLLHYHQSENSDTRQLSHSRSAQILQCCSPCPKVPWRALAQRFCGPSTELTLSCLPGLSVSACQDEATCQRQFYSATYLNISLPLYFSYSTCGYIYLNIDPAISQATQNWPSELRVSYPTVDDYRLFVAPARSMYSGTKFGVYPDLLDRSLLFLNYTGTIQERELTQQALDFSEQYFTYSSWSACVYMLAVNETDICAGPVRSPPPVSILWAHGKRQRIAVLPVSWPAPLPLSQPR